MRLPVNHAVALAGLAGSMLTGGGAVLAQSSSGPAPAPVSGPAADYPVVVGAPFTIGGTTWTPVDQLNYDAVGYAAVGGEGLVGVSGAHKTLPLPSYVEVTALDTGRTILVRLTQRGPMVNDTLVALSPDAAAQLGLAEGTRAPVRVRRVNPPEVERAALRQGRTAPPRMETPESLLNVLRRKLAEQSPLLPPPSTPPAMPPVKPSTITPVDPGEGLPQPAAVKSAPVSRAAAPAKPAAPMKPKAEMPTKAAPAAVPAPAAPKPPVAKPATAKAETARPETGKVETAKPAAKPASAAGTHIVQVAAFSTADRARKVAVQLGGHVSASGKYWRVQLGPYKGSGEAAPALEKAKAAGYRDARIQRAD